MNDTLSENTGILSIEQQVDACKLDILSSAIPVAAEPLSILIVCVDEDRAPVAATLLVLAQTLAGNGPHGAILSLAVLDPLLRQSAVVLCVVEGLEGEPVSRRSHRVAIVNTLYKLNFYFELHNVATILAASILIRF